METSDPNNEDQNTGKEPLALVQWIGGADAGNFSFVPTNWIRNFSTEEFLRDCNDDNSTCDTNSLAKCRSTKRKSKFGWKVDNAVVVKVLSSEKEMSTVVNALGEYDRIPHVTRKFAEPQVEPQSSNRPSQNSNRTSAESTCCSGSSSCLNQQLIMMEQTNKNNEKKIDALSKSVSIMSQKMDVLTNLVQTLVKSQSKPASPNIKKTANPLAKQTKAKQSVKKSAEPTVKTEKVCLFRTNFRVGSKYEIGQEGSGILVDRNQWSTISVASRKTPTCLAVALVKALFPRNILLISNLRGGKCTIRKSDGPNRAALDQTIIKVIYDHVAIKFPKWNYKEGDLGKAINAMLNDLRSKTKRNEIKTEMKEEIKEEPIHDLCNEDDFA